jgi:hypothetical protein
MWKLIDKPRTVRVTKPIAREFAEMDAPPQDRPLNERRLLIYRRMLANESFRPVSWARCYCKETGGTYRINGKHTSTLLAGLESLPEFYAVIESYEAETLEDVARLYATFDSKTQSRTSNDINRAFAASVPELAPLPAKLISVAVTGISYAKWLDAYSTHTAADRAELLLDHTDFVLWLHDLIGGHKETYRHLYRGPVVAAMFQTWQKSHKDATTFWLAVRDETGEMPSLPDRRLAKWLSTMYLSFGMGAAGPAYRRASSREFLVRCIHAWNAWRKGKTTDLKYHPNANVPAVA